MARLGSLLPLRVLCTRSMRTLLTVALIVSTACSAALPMRSRIALPGAAPTATSGAAHVEVAGVTAAPGSAEAGVQSVILRGNSEQAQAIAAHNATVMADTSTDRYYQEVAQTNQELLAHGVVSIALLK